MRAEYEGQQALAASSLLEVARAEGADDSQLEVLESVAESGRDVLYSEYTSAIGATLECLEASGFTIDGPSASSYNGQDFLAYGFRPPEEWSEEQMNAVSSDCSLKYSVFVDLLYQTNTASKVYIDDAFERARPAVIACLAEYGYDLPADSTIGEIAPVVVEVSNAFGEAADCYVRSGFTAALN